MEQREFPIDPNKARVYLHYSRYWHFCKYSGKYKSGHVKNQKKYFFEVLAEIYTLTQWKFCYLQWIMKKMDELNHMLDPTPYIDKDNAPLDYFVHLTDCYNLLLCD